MPHTADVLIVGGGVAGTTLALELARSGVDVVLLERRYVGGGSSSLNAGGVRQQFSQETNVRVAAKTLRRIEALRDDLGEEVAFRRAGYLLLYTNQEQERVVRDAIALQNRWDVPTRLISVEDAAELVPGARLDGVLGAAFGSTDGYVDPRAVVTAFGRAAVRAGARLMVDEVTGVETASGRATAVVTRGGGRISAGTVVNAAGAWAPALARLYGGDLPIEARRSDVFVLDHPLVAGRVTPMVLDFALGMSYHTEGRGFLISAGRGVPVPDAPVVVRPDLGFFDEVKERIEGRLPETAGYNLAHSWAGLIEITPDNNPVVGWTHLENVFTIAGFSGHGMCIAPGLAPEAARLLRGEQPRIPLDAYAPDRFTTGRELEPEAIWSGARVYEALERS